MNVLRSLLFVALTSVPGLGLLGFVRAAEPDPMPRPEGGAAANDQDRPNGPPRGRDDRGPGGQPNFGPPVDPTAPRGGPGFPASRGPGSPGFNPSQPVWPQNPFGMRQNDPEMEKLMQTDFNLDRESRELAGHYRQASKDTQEEIKKKLKEVVAKQFEARQERRTLELKRLEDEIKRIRESIDKKNSGKQQIVDRRVNELLGEDDTSF
jgi:hypothetical protein